MDYRLYGCIVAKMLLILNIPLSFKNSYIDLKSKEQGWSVLSKKKLVTNLYRCNNLNVYYLTNKTLWKVTQ